MTLTPHTSISAGNAIITRFLDRYARGLKRNYEQYDIPLEWHNSYCRQLHIYDELLHSFGKHDQYIQQFRADGITDIERFYILIKLIKIKNDLI